LRDPLRGLDFFQSDLKRWAASRWALPQIFSYLLLVFCFVEKLQLCVCFQLFSTYDAAGEMCIM